MIETVYIARHGFRLNWLTTNWKSETSLPRDPPLAAYGITQANELAEHFKSLPEDQRPTAIFSSPYYRCLQTAAPTAAILGIPLYVEHGLSEWYSPVEPGTGLHPRPGSATSLQKYIPIIDPSWSSLYYPSRKGEEVPAFQTRGVDLLRLLIPEIERSRPAHRRILLCTHAATVIVLARAFLGKIDLELRVGCASLTEVVRDTGGDKTKGPLEGWEARKLADGKHLSGGSLREWGMEDIQIDDGKVINDPGEPGSENEVDEPVGPQIQMISNL